MDSSANPTVLVENIALTKFATDLMVIVKVASPQGGAPTASSNAQHAQKACAFKETENVS